MTLTKGLIRADLIAARQAIEYYDTTHIKDIKNVAAYHLQQAAEKLIKYQMYQRSRSLENRRMYTHDLNKLIDYAESENIEIRVPPYILEHMNTITDWEAGSRYDFEFSVRIDVLKKCYNLIAEWEKQV